MTIALLDGDIIAYTGAILGEDRCPFGGEPALDRVAAFKGVNDMVERWRYEAQAKDVIVVLSGKDNFRMDVLPTYKQNRAGKEKPALYNDVVNFIEEKFRTIRKPRLEADDTLGILGTSDPKKYVVVSADKDMRTLPCRVIIPGKMPIPIHFREWEANRFWMTQTLTGDTVDGYGGCPKIGPVKAERILDGLWKLPDLWSAVVDTYKAAGLTEADALVQARVARILRNSDFDRETREIKLWAPRATLSERLPTEPPLYQPQPTSSPKTSSSSKPNEGSSSPAPRKSKPIKKRGSRKPKPTTE